MKLAFVMVLMLGCGKTDNFKSKVCRQCLEVTIGNMVIACACQKESK